MDQSSTWWAWTSSPTRCGRQGGAEAQHLPGGGVLARPLPDAVAHSPTHSCAGLLQVDQMCPTWFYERDPTIPPNLYDAMVQVRRSRGPTPVISSYPQGAASPAEAPGRWGQQAPAGERAPAQTAASPI